MNFERTKHFEIYQKQQSKIKFVVFSDESDGFDANKKEKAVDCAVSS